MGRQVSIPLNSQQQELATEYFNIVEKVTYHWMKKFPDLSYEEVYDAVVISLIRAARGFNSELGWQFTTYFGNVVERAVKNVKRDKHAKKRFDKGRDPLSFDREFVDGDMKTSLLQMIGNYDKYSFEDQNYLNVLFEELTPFQKQCIELYFIEGLKQQEIANEFNCSQAHVNRCITKGIEMMKLKAIKMEKDSEFDGRKTNQPTLLL